MREKTSTIEFWRSGSYGEDGYQSGTPSLTLEEATVTAEGDIIQMLFTAEAFVGPGGNAGFVFLADATPKALTYVSGAGTYTLIHSIASPVAQGQVCTLSYTQPGNGLQAIGGQDLASFASSPVTNDSAVP